MQEEIKKQTSIYHVNGLFIESKTDLKNIKPWTEDMDKGMGNYGLAILKIITRYGMLNKACILKSVQTINPTKWKQDMLTKTLKALRKADYIRMFQMTQLIEGDASLIAYCITEKGEEYLKNKKIVSSYSYNPYALITYKDVNTTEEKELLTFEIMRLLALNQWHINMLYNFRDRITNSYLNSFKAGEIVVPSMITYKPYKADLKGSKELTLFTFQAPNNDASFEILASQILETYKFLIKKEHQRYRPGIIIILCENMNHSAWVSWKFNNFRQLRQLNSVLYTIDITTNKERMLALLNECSSNEAGIVRHGINIE